MKTTESTLKQPAAPLWRTEIRKIGYGLILVGIIAMIHAWSNIIQNESTLWEVLFLFIGLVATLGGINLVIRYVTRDRMTLKSNQMADGHKQ